MIRLSKLPTALLTVVLTMPAVFAHPGHYHPPGEDDEFNGLRADWLHLHGWIEMGLALLAVFSVALFVMGRRPAARVGAAILFGGSLALIAAL